MVVSVFAQTLKLCRLTADVTKKPENPRIKSHTPGECEDAMPAGTNCVTCGVLKKWTEFFIRKDTNKYRGECKKCYLKRQEKYRKRKPNVAENS